MKKLSVSIFALFLIIGGLYAYQKLFRESPAISEQADYKNISYEIEGDVVKLVNGGAETVVAPNSGTTITTEYFGNEARGDINSDGTEDVAFILTQDSGGSGVFYYVVVALKLNNGYKGLNAIFLGDRIAPQTTEFRDGRFIVNYADRSEGEPFSTDPSIGVSKYLEVEKNKLVEVSG